MFWNNLVVVMLGAAFLGFGLERSLKKIIERLDEVLVQLRRLNSK